MRKTNLKTKPALVVTDVDLLNVLALRDEVSKARKAVSTLEAKLASAEGGVMTLLRLGAVNQGPIAQALIEESLGPVRPKYQELWLNHMAADHGMVEEAAMQVARDAYPAKKIEALVISRKKS